MNNLMQMFVWCKLKCKQNETNWLLSGDREVGVVVRGKQILLHVCFWEALYFYFRSVSDFLGVDLRN